MFKQKAYGSQPTHVSTEEYIVYIVYIVYIAHVSEKFQYELLHIFYYCLTLNPHLLKIGIRTSEISDLFQQQKEILQHIYFVFCIAKLYWDHFYIIQILHQFQISIYHNYL